MISILAIAIALLPLLAAAADDASAAAASPADDAQPAALLPLVLLPPDNALQVCGPETFRKFTKTFKSCARSFYEYKDPDADCCEGLAWYYGPNTTKPSANCYCDKATWEALVATGALNRYDLGKAFKICGKYGFDVPFYVEQDGLCYGVRPDMDDIMALTFEGKGSGVDLPSTANWFSRLDRDSVVLTATVTGIMSVFGFAVLVWPVAFDAAHCAHGALKSLRSPRSRNRQ